MSNKHQSHAKDASEAHCNLNMYGAITALCESSLFLGGRDRLCSKIVRLCKVEQLKELARYDAAMEKLGEGA